MTDNFFTLGAPPHSHVSGGGGVFLYFVYGKATLRDDSDKLLYSGLLFDQTLIYHHMSMSQNMS